MLWNRGVALGVDDEGPCSEVAEPLEVITTKNADDPGQVEERKKIDDKQKIADDRSAPTNGCSIPVNDAKAESAFTRRLAAAQDFKKNRVKPF